MSYILRNQFGAVCAVCQSHLSPEADDFNTCDTCGGEGFGEDGDEPPAPHPRPQTGEERT